MIPNGALIFYALIMSMLFVYLFSLFLRDKTTPKTHVMSWIALIAASLFWPLTLPSVLRKQLSRDRHDTDIHQGRWSFLIEGRYYQ